MENQQPFCAIPFIENSC
ncbi:hypothetical protein Avbf_16073 [Armadillidium vulgare]|nr:hypothetical protein Avbf_16073 [Armadillidium vulgare]